MHFYFDITLQFLIMKKRLKTGLLFTVLVYKFLVCVRASFAGKRFTSTNEVNIFLVLCHGWYVSVISPRFSCYLWQDCLNSSSDTPKTACRVKKTNKKKTERSAHKAIKITLMSKQNTVAPEEKIALWLSREKTPPPPPQCLGAHFYAWLNTYFCHPGVVVFSSKCCKDLNFFESCKWLLR